jgi:hypothetical protein
LDVVIAVVAEGLEKAGEERRGGGREAEGFDFGDGEEFAGRGGHEDGVGAFEVGGGEVAFEDGDAGQGEGVEEDFTGDAGEAAGVEGRGEDGLAEDGEEVGGGAFTDAAVFVEEDDFVVAALAGLFVPGEVLGPGGDFGAGEFTGSVAGVGFEGEAGGGRPGDEVFGEGDEVVGAGEAGAIEGSAGVADDGEAEGGVFGVVGGDEAEEVVVDRFRGGGHGDVHALGVAEHALPVALVGEQDAVGDVEGGEDAPAVEQAGLAGGEEEVGGVAELFVVEQAAMHALIVAAL